MRTVYYSYFMPSFKLSNFVQQILYSWRRVHFRLEYKILSLNNTPLFDNQKLLFLASVTLWKNVFSRWQDEKFAVFNNFGVLIRYPILRWKIIFFLNYGSWKLLNISPKFHKNHLVLKELFVQWCVLSNLKI